MLTLKIDLQKLKNHALTLKKLTEAKLCAVVKADAYGHGISQSVFALSDIADYFAISDIREGAQIRRLGIDTPIIIFGAIDFSTLSLLDSYKVEPSVLSLSDIIALSKSQYNFNVHIKVNTGMNRLGVAPEDISAAVRTINASTNITLKGIYTHFAKNQDKCDYLTVQNTAFFDIITNNKNLITSLDNSVLFHAAATGGILNGKEFHHDMVRSGVGLYGYYPDQTLIQKAKLLPVMSAHSQLIDIRQIKKGDCIGYENNYTAPRDLLVGVVAAGYADGIPRNLSNKGKVFLPLENRYIPCPILGNISMDLMTVELPDDFSGDDRTVDFINEFYTAEDMAKDSGTISYEILTGFAKRVKRVYI